MLHFKWPGLQNSFHNQRFNTNWVGTGRKELNFPGNNPAYYETIFFVAMDLRWCFWGVPSFHAAHSETGEQSALLQPDKGCRIRFFKNLPDEKT
jgi:hypothetical protein